MTLEADRGFFVPPATGLRMTNKWISIESYFRTKPSWPPAAGNPRSMKIMVDEATRSSFRRKPESRVSKPRLSWMPGQVRHDETYQGNKSVVKLYLRTKVGKSLCRLTEFSLIFKINIKIIDNHNRPLRKGDGYHGL